MALNPAPFDMPPQVGTAFDPARGAWVIQRLMSEPDLGFTNVIHPAAIVGNLAGESRLTAIQEVHPIAGRGGFGWEQATGSRRVAFEYFCQANGFKNTDDRGNYEFLVSELLGAESHALDRLKATTTLEAAVYTFEVAFERPSSTSDVGSRVHYAQRALAAMAQVPAPPGPTTTTTPIDPNSDAAAEELNKVEEAKGTTISVTTPAPEMIPKPGPVEPARTSPGVAVVGGVGFLGSMAVTLQYAGPIMHLPLMTDNQALGISGFLVAICATLFHLYANKGVPSP